MFPSRTASLQRQKQLKTTRYKSRSYTYKFRGTYVGALLRARPLMPNLRAGFTTRVSLLASTVIFTSELLVEGVAPVPIDRSIVVEGTAVPPQHHPQMMISVAFLPPDFKNHNTNQ